MGKKLYTAILAASAVGLNSVHAALPSGTASTVGGYVDEVSTIGDKAYLIAGGFVLVGVILRYLRKAGK